MYMKSLVSLAVLGAMSAVATAGDLVVFDKPNESYTVDGLNKYGATIKASDITITNTTYNGIDAYGVFDLNAANDISIQGATNGIFTPSDHQNSSIKITTPKKLTITGPWAIHAEGKGTITIDAGDLVLRGSNGIAANSTGTVSIDAQTVDIASTNKYGVSSANTGGVTIKAEKSIYIKGGSANAVNGLQGAITLDSKGTTVVDGDILVQGCRLLAHGRRHHGGHRQDDARLLRRRTLEGRRRQQGVLPHPQGRRRRPQQPRRHCRDARRQFRSHHPS